MMISLLVALRNTILIQLCGFSLLSPEFQLVVLKEIPLPPIQPIPPMHMTYKCRHLKLNFQSHTFRIHIKFAYLTNYDVHNTGMNDMKNTKLDFSLGKMFCQCGMYVDFSEIGVVCLLHYKSFVSIKM